MSANTSGTDVVNVGMVPLAAIPGLIAYLGTIQTQLKAVADANADPVALDFMKQGGSDRVPDATMSEICRRLVATIERGNQQDIIFSPTAPDDHTKAWQPIDPLTLVPVGQYKLWDGTSETWKTPETIATPVYTPPQEFTTTVLVAPGNSAVNIDLPDFKTTKYSVHLTPTTLSGSSYLPGPTTVPNTFGWLLTGKTNTQTTITFYGVPNIGSDDAPVGVVFEVWARATPAE